MRVLVQLIVFAAITNDYRCIGEVFNSNYKWPSVGITVLVRDKAHTLPYFFSCLNKLDYPKDRIYLWIYSDFNEDNSDEVIEKWYQMYSKLYHGVYFIPDSRNTQLHEQPQIPKQWNLEHFKHIINLRGKGLRFAKKMWVDYVLMIDADVYLTNPAALKLLVSKNEAVVAPMLVSDGLFSNFWCGITEEYYYKRTDDYRPILDRERIGCFEVPMVHTAVLISLRHVVSDSLSYEPNDIANYKGPTDDIIAFAISAKENDVKLKICNDEFYGFMQIPPEDNSDVLKDHDHLRNVKLEAISRGSPLPLDSAFVEFVSFPQATKLGFDEIYVINLERRKERRELMMMSFYELGMDVKWFKAVDGKKLEADKYGNFSITFMPNYEDPYHKRPMKAGEVGCFLSHYLIWQEVVQKEYSMVMVLEDDIHFERFFIERLKSLMDEVSTIEWDLMYLGRKILLDGDEQYVTQHTTRPLYSYWTLGYLIRLRGAQKLLSVNPLSKMLPVDEFLPIMFDQHPNNTWKAHFPHRDLIALSAAPLLVHPTHYTGQPGYISDTEDSEVISKWQAELQKTDL